ncbi:putative immunity protein [uncultured Sphaerochaeta sp.]|uniref:putative immunity protein n=1 Tax=uncultured Sphaerochaeta sp. TaxID=886478 RepID=UPI002A0A6ABF|nr:hypothetical protein [uncultured Sphaerochaeta sp.]
MELEQEILTESNGLKDKVVLLDHKTAALWATACAEHVLPLYEALYPGDDRPRVALEAGKAWAKGSLSTFEARKAALSSLDASRKAFKDGNSLASEVAHACSHACTTTQNKEYALHTSISACKAAGDQASEQAWQTQCLEELLNPVS